MQVTFELFFLIAHESSGIGPKKESQVPSGPPLTKLLLKSNPKAAKGKELTALTTAKKDIGEISFPVFFPKSTH